MATVIENKKQKQIYLGDPRLKAPNVTIQWDKEDVEEYEKCFNDPVYFIEHYIKIVHVDKGIVPFVMYDYQKEIISLYQRHRFVVSKLPRQSGKCLDFSVCINIRNKETGVSNKITIGEFYEWQKLRSMRGSIFGK